MHGPASSGRGGLQRHCRRIGSLVATIVICAAATAAGQDRPALLELHVNGVPKGDVVVWLRGDEVWIPIHQLEAVGLHEFTGTRDEFDGEPCVALTSLRPDVRGEIDERDLSLRLDVAPERLRPTVLELRSSRPSGIEYGRAPSAFLNYGVTWRGESGYDIAAEVGASLDGALAVSTFSRGAGGRLLRGLTSVTFDQPGALRRISVGDSFVSTGELGGGVLLGGATIGRDFELDPYFVAHPTVGLRGAAATPSTVEVYVNDTLVRRQHVPPGPIELSALPVTTGRGDTRLVVRDAFGGERTFTNRYYLASTGLARGVHEYHYAAGFTRERAADASWGYGTPVLAARHRVGLTDAVTFGARAEVTPSLVSGGPLLNLRTRFGEVGLGAAASLTSRAPGGAASLSYSYLARPAAASLVLRLLGAGYETIGGAGAASTAGVDGSGMASVRLGSRGTLTAEQAIVTRRDGRRTARTALSASFAVGRRASAIVTIGRRVEGRRPAAELFIGTAIAFRAGATAMLSRHIQSESATTLHVQKSLSVGQGYGYRVELSDARNGTATGTLQYQSSFGRYELTQGMEGGRSAPRATVAGGLAAVGGRLFATRPVQDGFALVRLPGIAGVRVFASNQPVGRTDGRGDALIPNLLPYYGNRLAIADQDVPFAYMVEEVERTVAPPRRGAALVHFRARRVQGIRGLLALQSGGGIATPSGGVLSVVVDDRMHRSPVAPNGEIYFEDLPPGTRAAALRVNDEVFSCVLVIPASPDLIVDLGIVPCRREALQP